MRPEEKAVIDEARRVLACWDTQGLAPMWELRGAIAALDRAPASSEAAGMDEERVREIVKHETRWLHAAVNKLLDSALKAAEERSSLESALGERLGALEAAERARVEAATAAKCTGCENRIADSDYHSCVPSEPGSETNVPQKMGRGAASQPGSPASPSIGSVEWLREQMNAMLDLFGVPTAGMHDGDRATILGAQIRRALEAARRASPLFSQESASPSPEPGVAAGEWTPGDRAQYALREFFGLTKILSREPTSWEIQFWARHFRDIRDRGLAAESAARARGIRELETRLRERLNHGGGAMAVLDQQVAALLTPRQAEEDRRG